MSFALLASLAGGVGLLLLGMRLLTDGLKLAAGHALRNILARWTGTPARGLAAGALITAVVQASGAVTVATIGFVNAGLMSLKSAVLVIYGSNVGTTMTAWLVALMGFHVDIKAFALPAVGAGMLLRLIYAERRQGAIGETLAGFGVFFIGIDVLRTAFTSFSSGVPLEAMNAEGLTGLLLFVGVGFALTLLMQSSSAALAITLTAAAGGALPLNVAAAVVIGANVGTTSTAALAVIGATPNAKRVAGAHVAFNLITGAVALFILPLLLASLLWLRETLSLDTQPATLLALFHTLFNLLGIALMWPVTGRLVRFLERRFHVAEEDEARPRYLDRNVVGTPVLAMHALAMEQGRIGNIARRMTKSAISSEVGPGPRLTMDKSALDRLVQAAGEFSTLVQRSNLPAELDDVLPNALRVSRYYTEMAELAGVVADGQKDMPPVTDATLSEDIAHFKGAVVKLLDAADTEGEGFSMAACSAQLEALKEEYQRLKSRLLRSGTAGQLPVRQMVDQLDVLSDIRRIAEQAEKAARYLDTLRALTAVGRGEGEEAQVA